MKKNHSIIIISLILLILPVFAQSSSITRVRDLGLIKGNGTDMMLGKYLKREEALVILARMMGEEELAKKCKTIPAYSDVPLGFWASPYISYATQRAWSNGIGGNQFGIGQTISAEDYATLMYRALGRDKLIAYDMIFDDAMEIGLFDGLSLNDFTPLSREEAFVIMNNTLDQIPYGKQRQLIYELGLIADEHQREKGSIYAPQKTNNAYTHGTNSKQTDNYNDDLIEVISVEPNGLNQLRIEFSSPVPESIDFDDFDLDSNGSARLRGGDYEISDDGKIVYLTFSTPAENNELVDLQIMRFLPKRKRFKNIVMRDATMPSVYGARIIGYNYVRVDFSEPMGEGLKDKANYRFFDSEHQEIFIKKIKAIDNRKSVIIETVKKLDRGSELKMLEGIKDLAGISVDPEKFRIDYVADDNPPEIIDYYVEDPYRVVLYFDKPFTVEAGRKSFAHTSTEHRASDVNYEYGALIIDFDKDEPLEEGQADIFIKRGALKDFWDNYNRDIWYTITVPEF